MQDHFVRSVGKCFNRVSSIVALLLLSSVLRAEEVCPIEIKLLISPPTIKSVIASLSFGKRTEGRVYLFDTDNLGLLKQGVIVRVRQGAKNDLTIKVRLPEDNEQAASPELREQFGCEIDRTSAGADTSFSVGQEYKHQQIPETGDEIFKALTSQQKRLLRAARVRIDWSQVKRIANINSTTWETQPRSLFRKLTLESWEWPTGNILELSARVASNESESRYTELQQIVNTNGISLSANQGTKTSLVLKTLTPDASPAR